MTRGEIIIILSLVIAFVAVSICGFVICVLYIRQLRRRSDEITAGCSAEVSQNQNQTQTQSEDLELAMVRNLSEAGSDDVSTKKEERQGSIISSVDRKEWKSKCCVGSECAICLEEFKDGEQCKVLSKCNHTYHLTCIDTWLAKDKHCPLCRTCVRGSRSCSEENNNNNNNNNRNQMLRTSFNLRHIGLHRLY